MPVTVEVTNKGSVADRFELQVEGIDPEWSAVPEAVFVVDPNESHAEKVFIKVPRSSESQAGNYPFVIRIRSLNSGEARPAQGVIQVKPFHYLTMEINPKKGFFSPMRKQNVFTLTVLNLGNTEHTLQLFGSDPEEACTYEFETEQIHVDPGQQKTVEMEAIPNSRPFLSSSRLHGFSVSGRSVESPSLLASAQAQLEQRPFLTPASLILVIFLVLLGLGWAALLPKPPQVSLAISKRAAFKGEVIKLTWRAQHATSVQVTANGEPLVPEAPTSGETDYVADKVGTIVFIAKAVRDTKESEGDEERLVIEEPPASPKPVVTLKAKRRTINLGDSVELEYSVENAVEAFLMPEQRRIGLNLKAMTVQPTKEGSNEYEIVATGKDGQTSSARVTINVVDKAKVVVLAFGANPKTLEVGGGYVTLTWQVSNAARVEILGGEEAVIPDNPNTPGSQEFMIDKTTTFTIKAIDANGKSVSKTVRVEVAKPEEPPIGPGDPAGTPPVTTTGGGL